LTESAWNHLALLGDRSRFKQILERHASLGVLILSFSWLSLFSFLDFDSHHDGYMLAQAIALRDGLLMHTQVAGQYGPVSPLTQSWFLSLPFGEAFSLRIWTVFHLSLTAFFIADLGRVWPNSWDLPRQVFPIGAALWVLSSDVPAFGYMLPWSSVQGTFFNVLALYLLLGAKKNWERNPVLSVMLGLLSGAIIGLIPFARINVGLALWGAVLLLWIGNHRQVLAPSKLFTMVGVGAFGSAVTVFLLMELTGATNAFVTQAILNPARWAISAGASNQWNTANSLVEIAITLIPSILIALLAILLYGSRNTWLGRSVLVSRLRRKPLILPIILGAIASLALSNPPVLDYLASEEISAADLRILTNTLMFSGQANAVYLLVFLSLGAWVLRLVIEARRSSSVAHFFQRCGPLIVLGAFSLANLVQIYPTHDGRHAWWGSALSPLLLIASAWGLFTPHQGISKFLASTVAIQFLLVFGVSGANLSYPRFPAPQTSSAHGLQVRIDDLERINVSLEVLQKIPPSSQALFVTNDGFVAVADGTYRPSSKDFVWWAAPDRNLRESVTQADYIVYQESAVGDLDNQEFQTMFPTLNPIFCKGSYCVFGKN